MSSETSIPFPSASRERTTLSSQEIGADSGEAASAHPEVEVYRDDRTKTTDLNFECFVEGPTDEKLLERVSQDDKAALSLLFRRHARMVRVLAERILRDRGEADDLVQEVFLFVFRRAALFDSGKGSARSWLAQVTYHRAIDRRRQLMSRRFYSSVELEEGILQSEEPLGRATLYDDTLEAVLGKDTLRRIDKSLSDDQRKVIHLHFVDGYTVAEIAEMIGQSVGNVRNHYYPGPRKNAP